MSFLRTTLLISLPILSFLGFYNTFYTARLNGTGRLLFSVLRSGPSAKFPGSDGLLVRYYTGVPQVDQVLTMLVAFFAHTVDGSLLWFGKFGAGQFGAAWALLVMEGLREGNRHRLVSWTGMLGIFIQLFALTCVTPLYLFLTLITSPVTSSQPPKESLLISSNHLAMLPLTIFLSYLIPTISMGLDFPQYTDLLTHQRLIALWQIFPALTTSIHYILTSLVHTKQRTQQTSEKYILDSHRLRQYILVLSVSTYILPITSSLRHHAFMKSFMPFSLEHSSTTPVLDLATGVKNFLQWDIYIASLTIFIWSFYLYWETRRQNEWRVRGVKLTAWWQLLLVLMFGGPISVAVILLDERERMVLVKSEGIEKKTN